MKKTLTAALWMISLSVLMLAAPPSVHAQSQNEVRFVSSPDLFNFDVPNPTPEWEDAINWYLRLVKAEQPDLFLVAGDLVDGRWHNPGARSVKHMGMIYYEGWKRRMHKHGLRYAPAIGDHELGDDPWGNDKRKLVPTFRKVFLKHLEIPGERMPTDEKVAYYVGMGNVLFITVDTFHDTGNNVETTVTGDQLKWMKQVLQKYGPKADHIIVQGHAPVIGDPKSTSSSQLMVKNGRESQFWQLMKAAGVDAYLCGEFHALTTNQKDGIWQIVHGTSWGRKGHKQTYLVGHATPKGLKLTIKRFPLEVKGDKMWNLNKPGGPREIVRIPEDVQRNGPETVGSIIIQKQGNQRRQINASGVFDK